MSRGRRPVRRDAAAAWLAQQDWLHTLADPLLLHYRRTPGDWRTVADAVRGAGFFSVKTNTGDVPVAAIVREARALVAAGGAA